MRLLCNYLAVNFAEGYELDADLRKRTAALSYVDALHQCVAPVGIWHQELDMIVEKGPAWLVCNTT